MQKFSPNDVVRPKGNTDVKMKVVTQEGNTVFCRIAGIRDDKSFSADDLELIPILKVIPPLRPTFG